MAPFWRVAFDEDDEESRNEAMGIFYPMNELLDKFSELGIDPSVQMMQDALNAPRAPTGRTGGVFCCR